MRQGVLHTHVLIGQGQPTRCGHTLTRCPLPGLAGAYRPSTPVAARAFVPIRRQVTRHSVHAACLSCLRSKPRAVKKQKGR